MSCKILLKYKLTFFDPLDQLEKTIFELKFNGKYCKCDLQKEIVNNLKYL